MAKKNINMIFLSASIPLEERHKKYFETADVIAIRDAVRALATVVIPKSILVWGGHPAITPLIRYVLNTMQTNVKDHVTLFQSNFFRDKFPEDNQFFENVVIVPEGKDLASSLERMRTEMFTKYDFKAGIFIGGMEGIEDEFNMFRQAHPMALLLPVASTGAAAGIIYNNMTPKPDTRLLTDYAYMALFKSLLGEYIN
jgi:hypothetical protein